MLSQNTTPETRKPLPDRSYFMASGVAGIVSHVIAHPISTVVSRLQISRLQSHQVQSVHDIVFPNMKCDSLMAKTRSLCDGFWSGGFYRVSSRTMRYGGQPVFSEWLSNNFSQNVKHYFNPDESKILFDSLAGASMAILHIIVFAPFDNIKTKKQNGNPRSLLQLIQQERMNLYNGAPIMAALAKDVPKALTLFGTSSAVLQLLTKFNEPKQEVTLPQLVTSATAGAFASVIFSNPMGVLKARIQNQCSDSQQLSLLSMFRKTVQDEGFPALFKGISFRFVLAIPEKVLPLVLATYLVSIWNKAEKEAAEVIVAAPRPA